ncbi:MAG TPA: ornithine cyclodeaminase family protein [Sphingobium sp.]
MILIGAEDIERLLTQDICIPLIRAAMAAFSTDHAPQMLRSVVQLDGERQFGAMLGHLNGTDMFGAKLVSVFPDGRIPGRKRHRGLVTLFAGDSGEPLCVADAEAITAARTAAATTVATEALARRDASRLLILGCGTQARAHLEALTLVRDYTQILVWGRSFDRAHSFAGEESARLGRDIQVVADAEEAARASDVICTVTSAAQPVLLGRWIAPGTHVNLIGSSVPGPVECDSDLIAMARLFVDSEQAARAQAAEYLAALSDGSIEADHIIAEVGDVLAGHAAGRRSAEDVTAYKSLGLVVQDLAILRYLYDRIGVLGDEALAYSSTGDADASLLC